MRKRSSVLPLVFLSLVACVLLSAPYKAGGDFAPVVDCDDEFDGADLDPKWSMVNGENKEGWSLTAHPGCLRITTLPGEFLHTPADAQNVLLQEAPAGDWTIVTKVTGLQGKPNHNWEQAGLIVYQDDDHWLKLVRLYADRNVFQIGRENGGFWTWYEELTPDDCASATIYLKIVKRGNKYSGYFSEDGVEFTQAGKTQTLSFTKIKIGLLAFNGCDFHEEKAIMDFDFDFFRLTQP